MEVLLSSVSPSQLMSGKIWGIAATGLTMVLSWVGFALLGVWLAPMIINGFDFPLMAVVGDPRYLISFVAYFMAGYLLYAAVLVAIGSVCNTLKEAQNLMQPVIIMLIVPLVAMIPIVQEPNGLVAKVMSYIPLFTPFTMMNRAGGPPETYEYVITGILLLATVIFAFKAAGKIFRVGVLMTGKPPKLREIFGWLRQS
jgi:ABC-2 type transport system permease protein